MTLHLIPRLRCAEYAGQMTAPFSRNQWALLWLLATAGGAAVKREQIMVAIWEQEDVTEWALDRLVARVRERLRAISPRRHIVTVSGYGFRWDEIGEEDATDTTRSTDPATGRLRPQRPYRLSHGGRAMDFSVDADGNPDSDTGTFTR